MPDRNSPVFTDHTGRRWRGIRLAALVVGGAAALFACVLIAAELFTPPIPPEMSIAAINARSDSPRPKSGPGRRAIDPARLAYRRRLAASLRRIPDAPPRHDAMVPVATVDPRSLEAFLADRRGLLRQLGRQLARFADAQLDKLDWVVGEWAFIPRTRIRS